jgi:hypothetical protein
VQISNVGDAFQMLPVAEDVDFELLQLITIRQLLSSNDRCPKLHVATTAPVDRRQCDAFQVLIVGARARKIQRRLVPLKGWAAQSRRPANAINLIPVEATVPPHEGALQSLLEKILGPPTKCNNRDVYNGDLSCSHATSNILTCSLDP